MRVEPDPWLRTKTVNINLRYVVSYESEEPGMLVIMVNGKEYRLHMTKSELEARLDKLEMWGGM